MFAVNILKDSAKVRVLGNPTRDVLGRARTSRGNFGENHTVITDTSVHREKRMSVGKNAHIINIKIPRVDAVQSRGRAPTVAVVIKIVRSPSEIGLEKFIEFLLIN